MDVHYIDPKPPDPNKRTTSTTSPLSPPNSVPAWPTRPGARPQVSQCVVCYRVLVHVIIHRATQATQPNTFTAPAIRNFCASRVCGRCGGWSPVRKMSTAFCVCLFSGPFPGVWLVCACVCQVPFENDEDLDRKSVV